MKYEDKSKDELILEIKELLQKNNSLEKSVDKHITDQQRAAKMFQDIIDKNPMSMQFLDMEGYTIKVNSAHTKLFGTKPPPNYSLFNDAQLLKLGFGELFENIKNGEVVQFPVAYYNAHDFDSSFPNKPLWLKAIGFTLNDMDGKPEKIVLTHDNVTKSKLAEDELQESKKMLELVMDSIPQFIFWKDVNSVYLGCNKNFALVAGLNSTNEIIGKTDYDLVWKNEEADFFVECDRRIINSGIAEYHIIEPQLQANGKQAWLDTNKVPISNASGEVIGILGTYEDITERKRTEESLRASESLYRKMIVNSSLGMHFYSLNSKNQLIFIDFNPAASNILGIDNSQYIGKTIEEAFPPLIQTEVPARYRDAAEKGIPWTTEQIAYNDGKITGAYEVRAFQTESGSMVAVFKDITESKRSEIALQASELQFRNLFEGAADAIFIAEQESGIIVDANHAAEKLLQLPVNKIIGLNQLDLHPKEMGKYTKDTFRQHQQEANELNITNLIENKVVRADGTEVPVEILASEVFYKGKKCLMGTFRDIIERKQTELELLKAKEKAEESEEKFRKTIEFSPIPIAIAKNNGEMFLLNKQFVNIYGYTLDELPTIGKWFELAYPDEEYRNFVLNDWSKEVENSIKNNIPVSDKEYLVTCKNGEVKTVAVSAYFEKDISIGLFQDITDRKQAEEALQLSNERLVVAQKIAKIGDWEANLLTDELYWSQTIFDIFGLDSKSFKPSVTAFRNAVHPNDRELVRESEERSEQTGLHDVVHRIINASGEIRFVHELAIRCKDDQGKPIKLRGTVQDITERKHAELLLQEKTEEIEAQNEKLVQTINELLIAKEKAEESDRLKTAFLQNMSHEIRTPMNAIMGFSDLLVGNYDNKPKLEKFSHIINQRCSDLLDIINDILDISKIESGQLAVNNEVCNVIELFSELNLFFKEHQKRIGKQLIKFDLRFQCDKSYSVIQTDKVKLKQILINLISNAFKFTEKGSIECGCNHDNNQLIFYVADTGIGIPSNKHIEIFERFTQLHHPSIKNIGGTGLGLSIVKGLTGLLGGKIWIESEPGKGSTFYFSIPYINSGLPQQKPIEINANEEFNFKNKTILIVEDDIYNAEYIKEILADKGISFFTAEYGKDAIEITKNQPIDLILMDIRLSDMNGYEATRLIKQSNPEIKIIAQTAYASQDERQKAIDAGCIDYVSKPTKRELLLKLISKYLIANNND